MGAVEKDVLVILYIMSITQVTSRGGIVSPGHLSAYKEPRVVIKRPLLVSRPCIFTVFNLNEVYLPHVDI